ncbi:MAG: energy-coupling factor ABC transporter ATP-binding protein [Eubacterium coprostanoligenes]|uniref:energy-coupling factor ABC transporter ATP-binding protein n=1 Tax=Eubacterium coprostanoligenes TaxID=290054 RepID=UPI002357A1FC|nr:ABC transporter ATP-binding protein [Eubacterium coprostanoligenes]MCI7264296.1 energy-coupling factor ABC transporter ATP-binding protein [Eubacterium coprostanoligenes]
MIKLDDICFAYDSTPVLKHFSTEIADGEFVVIKGDNGCGKSTLLNIINALEFAEIGTYTFDGTVIDKKAVKNEQFAKAFHQKIGYVFQNTDAQLFCSSVYDEIAFAPRQMQLDETEIAKRVDDMLKLTGTEHLKERAPFHLSMGEKKKVAVASVLAMNPQVLILDEPMNFLDKKSREWLVEFLNQMHSVGKTIIIVSHTDDFDKMADRIIEL